MRIARLGTAFLFAIGSYGLSTLGVAAAPMPDNVASNPGPGTSVGVVSAPRWRAGSTWEYSDGYGLRVRDNNNGVTTFERLDSPGEWFSMRGFLRQDASSSDTQRQTIYRTVAPGFGDTLSTSGPLTFRREYLSNGELLVHASSWSVEGRDRITVPAGTFDCWVIVWRERSLRTNWTGFERWWYSPEAQQYVRMEYKYGTMEPASRVLMRYRLAPGPASEMGPAPAPAFIEQSLQPVRSAPVDAMTLAPVTIPVPPAPAPGPQIPAQAPDPMLIPLSRQEPEHPAPLALMEIPLGIVRMSPMFIAPMPQVAIDDPPAPELKEVPIAAARMEPMLASPVAEVQIDTPAPPPPRAIAMRSPISISVNPLAMTDVAVETETQPEPREIALPSIAMDEISAAPMTQVAIDAPVEASSELATLWPSDRIDDMRKRVMPYYDPDPFMPAPMAIKPEPASGIVGPFAFLGRLVRGFLSIFE